MDNNQFAPRVTHKKGDADGCKGDWPCSSCGKVISELPFKPFDQDPSRPNTLKCRECFKARSAR